MFAEGQEIPGYQLTSMSGGKEVVNTEKVFDIACEYLAEAKVFAHYKLDLTKLVKAVSDSAPRGKKKEIQEEFERKLFQAEAIKNKPRKNIVRKIIDKITKLIK